jgi:hypothetical protein
VPLRFILGILLDLNDGLGLAALHHRAVDKYPRTTHEYGNHVHICKHSYSTVDVNEQRNMVNSGVRGTKNNHLMIEVDCIYYLSYRNLL